MFERALFSTRDVRGLRSFSYFNSEARRDALRQPGISPARSHPRSPSPRPAPGRAAWRGTHRPATSHDHPTSAAEDRDRTTPTHRAVSAAAMISGIGGAHPPKSAASSVRSPGCVQLSSLQRSVSTTPTKLISSPRRTRYVTACLPAPCPHDGRVRKIRRHIRRHGQPPRHRAGIARLILAQHLLAHRRARSIRANQQNPQHNRPVIEPDASAPTSSRT